MPKSTRQFLFPDINVWLGLTYEGHIHHRIAKKWFESLTADAQLFFCRITQLGLLRLLTSAAVMGTDEVMNQVEAWAAYDRWLEGEQVSFLEEPPGMERAFRSMSRLPHPAPKDWADSYIGAFAQASDLTLVTFDRTLHSRMRQSIVLA